MPEMNGHSLAIELRARQSRPAVVNCLGVAAEQAAEILGPGSCQVLVIDSADSAYRQLGTTVALPQSCGAIRSACWEVAYPRVTPGTADLAAPGCAAVNR